MDDALVQKEIDKLKKDLDEFVRNANLQIARYEGAIGAMENMLRVSTTAKLIPPVAEDTK